MINNTAMVLDQIKGLRDDIRVLFSNPRGR